MHAFTINVIFLANNVVTSVVKSCQKLCMYIHKDAMYVCWLFGEFICPRVLSLEIGIILAFFPFIGQYDYVYIKTTNRQPYPEKTI